jgi:uncharacterized membrane protein
VGAAVDVTAVVGAVVAPVELEHAPTKVAAMMRPAKAPVRLRLFTGFSYWWARTVGVRHPLLR